MLHEFVRTNREDLIRRCRFKVAQRSSPPGSEDDLQYGVALVLDQLSEALAREQASPTAHEDAVFGCAPSNAGSVEADRTAALHGSELFRLGYSVDEVVHDYGDVCQAVTELAKETDLPVTVDEFHTLNRLLDNSIATAVSSYVRLHHSSGLHEGAHALHERLGTLADDQRVLLDTALNALEAIKAASGGPMGVKGMVLEDTLLQLRELIDRSLPEIRTASGMLTPAIAPADAKRLGEQTAPGASRRLDFFEAADLLPHYRETRKRL
jgi:hypothetical protein